MTSKTFPPSKMPNFLFARLKSNIIARMMTQTLIT